MEPRSRERGNFMRHSLCVAKDDGLQWSRAQESAEICDGRPICSKSGALQWSRAQESAEIMISGCGSAGKVSLQWSRAQESAEIGSTPTPTGSLGCFNGAALKRARKYCKVVDFASCDFELQWSRAQESAEMLKGAGAGPGKMSFNGAALKRARKYGCQDGGRLLLLASMEPRSRERGNRFSRSR